MTCLLTFWVSINVWLHWVRQPSICSASGILESLFELISQVLRTLMVHLQCKTVQSSKSAFLCCSSLPQIFEGSSQHAESWLRLSVLSNNYINTLEFPLNEFSNLLNEVYVNVTMTNYSPPQIQDSTNGFTLTYSFVRRDKDERLRRFIMSLSWPDWDRRLKRWDIWDLHLPQYHFKHLFIFQHLSTYKHLSIGNL